MGKREPKRKFTVIASPALGFPGVININIVLHRRRKSEILSLQLMALKPTPPPKDGKEVACMVGVDIYAIAVLDPKQ